MAFDIHIGVRGRTLVDIAGFDIPRGKVTFLFGESGIGKSLISKAFYGLLDPDDLDVRIQGLPYTTYLQSAAVHQIQRDGFFVFQEPSTHLNPLLTLGSQLREGSLQDVGNEQEILGRLWEDPSDLRDLLGVYPKPYRPSGGEKQRILLAMAFKKMDRFLRTTGEGQDAIFVFDEPTGSLDNIYRNLFLSLLFERYRKRRFTVLLITHDYSMVGEITRKYPDLASGIAFREVVSTGRKLTVEQFLPQTYLDWLGSQAPLEQTVTMGDTAKVLLTVQSGTTIFGRGLQLSHEPEGESSAPLVVRRGSLVYVKAPSGTGKTSLMKAMMGLIPAEHLEMKLGTLDITGRHSSSFWGKKIWGKRMTMVFQHADEALNPEATVSETFQGLPVRPAITQARAADILRELFDREITPEFLKARVKTLSGGQKQRLNLLRGLALETDILIADEPLNGLDFVSTKKVIALLRKSQERGKGIILISHNEEILDPLVRKDEVYYLRGEKYPGA